MTDYQLEKYKVARLEEIEKEKKIAKFSHMFDDDFPSTYRSSSRQASNWCFPEGIKRPKPKLFNDPLTITPTLSFFPVEWTKDQVKDLKMLLPTEDEYNEFKNFYNKDKANTMEKLQLLLELLEEHGDRLLDKRSLITDSEIEKIEQFGTPANYKEATEAIVSILETSYSEYLNIDEKLAECSEKYAKIIKNIIEGPGSQGIIFVYSTFTNMEGLTIFSKALEKIGYSQMSLDSDLTEDSPRYVLYTGEIDLEDRKKLLQIMTAKNNMHGEKCKIFLGSAAAAEGLDLKYIQQVHVMEPHWHEVRVQQVVGRARRFKSHVDLPAEERFVNVFRYHSVLPDDDEDAIKAGIDSTDKSIYALSMAKLNLNNKFLTLLKNCAIDCPIYLEKNYDKEKNPINCYSLPVKNDILFHACIGRDKIDAETAREYGTKEFTYKEISLKSVKYIIRMDETGKDYDYFDVKQGTIPFRLSYLYNYDIYTNYGGKLEKVSALVANAEGKKKLVTLDGLASYVFI